MAPPPLLLYHSLAVTPAMYSSVAPPGRGSASLEHIPRCWCGDAQLLTFKTSGNRGCLVPGKDLPLAYRSERRKLSVVAQSQHSGQSSRSRRAGQVPAEDQNKVMLVANHSGTGAKTQTATVASPAPFPPSQPQIGSPLLWIGVGVGISIFFSWAARRAQGYAMQQALKSMMQQTGQGGNPFAAGLGNNPFGQNANPFAGQGANLFAGMPPGFPFPPPPAPSSSAASTATVDVIASPVPSPPSEAQGTVEKPIEIKKTAFTDVTVDFLAEEEPITQKGPIEISQEQPQATSGKNPSKGTGVVDGAATSTDPRSYGGQASTSEAGKGQQSFVSMDMLERMLDDPKIQQMVFPYLPEEMRDPVTFKRMIQLPPVRQQLQEALNNMGGEDGLDMLKYMNSDVVKEQFEQIGLTPEEVVGKILANPDIASSLQNSRVVEAIMDCSQNPLNITKYQNDKEVMNALLKIAELFPGATGSPY